jgi:hypothetical protein
MPANRPEKPVDAVRELFATNRMQAAWNMLSRAEGDVERLSTLGAVVRMLDAKGLDLSDVAQALSAPAAKPAPTMADAFGFGDIFSHMRNRAAESDARPAGGTQPTDAPPPQRPTWRPRPSTVLQGAAVPERIYGRISLHDERPTQKGKMLVIGVIGQEAVYDPIVCFDDKIIDKIKIAAALDRVVSLKVRKPGNARQMPCAIAID